MYQNCPRIQSTVKAVENELKSVAATFSPAASNKRGAYLKISAKDKAIIGEYASKNGVAAAIRRFK